MHCGRGPVDQSHLDGINEFVRARMSEIMTLIALREVLSRKSFSARRIVVPDVAKLDNERGTPQIRLRWFESWSS